MIERAAMYVKAVIIISLPLIWALHLPEVSSVKYNTDAILNIDEDMSALMQTNVSHISVQDVEGTGQEWKRLALIPAVLVAVMFVCLYGQCMCKDPRACHERLEDVQLHAVFQPFWNDPLCLRDFEMQTIRKAMPRVALSISVWLIGMYGNNVSQAWLQRNMEGYYESRWTAKHPGDQSLLLWDAGHYFFPVVLAKPHVADVLAQLISTLTFVRFVVLPGPLSMRWTVLCRMFLIWGFLWAFRGIMVISTALPNPEKTCKPAISFPENILLEALANMPFVFWKSELTCHDVIFSGHAVAVTLATLVYLHYSERAPWPLFHVWPQWLSFLINGAVVTNMLVGFFIIIVSRTHYTADVLLGITMSVLVFQAYHAAVVVACVPESKPTIFNSSLCPILPLLRWFEEDAVDVASLNSSLRQKCPES